MRYYFTIKIWNVYEMKKIFFGILHKDEGATIGKEVNEVTFDNLLEFFFTLDADYRKDAV